MKKTIVAVFSTSILLVGCATQQICDPNKQETTPISRFEINQTNGTVFDTKTKLTWKICAEGQSYSGGHCTGEATRFTYNNAVQTFGDKGESWRLANLHELSSIVEGRCRNPAINPTVFPNSPSAIFWATSSHTPDSVGERCVSFLDGSSFPDNWTNDVSVRLVRGQQWIDIMKVEKHKQAELTAQQKREMEQAAKQAAAQAENDAYVTCNDKTSCDKIFSLSQIYINSMASQKIQVATDTIIETYNPTENGNIGMKAVKIPGKGSSAVIRLTVMCKADDGRIYDKLCKSKKLDIYNGFRPFVNKMLGD